MVLLKRLKNSKSEIKVGSIVKFRSNHSLTQDLDGKRGIVKDVQVFQVKRINGNGWLKNDEELRHYLIEWEKPVLFRLDDNWYGDYAIVKEEPNGFIKALKKWRLTYDK
jgi:hypothetical protein